MGIQRSEMRLWLDCHVAYFNAPRNDIRRNENQVWVSHQLSFRGNGVTVGIQRSEKCKYVGIYFDKSYE